MKPNLPRRLVVPIVLGYFLITAIDITLGSDVKAWNQLYFIKENALACYVTFLLIGYMVSSTKILIMSILSLFFFLRTIFSIFFFDHCNDFAFAIIFSSLIFLFLLTLLISEKWRN